jgi:hypothetical protein
MNLFEAQIQQRPVHKLALGWQLPTNIQQLQMHQLGAAAVQLPIALPLSPLHTAAAAAMSLLLGGRCSWWLQDVVPLLQPHLV